MNCQWGWDWQFSVVVWGRAQRWPSSPGRRSLFSLFQVGFSSVLRRAKRCLFNCIQFRCVHPRSGRRDGHTARKNTLNMKDNNTVTLTV